MASLDSDPDSELNVLSALSADKVQNSPLLSPAPLSLSYVLLGVQLFSPPATGPQDY